MEDDYGFRFRKWRIYGQSREFRQQVYLLVESFPAHEKYILVDHKTMKFAAEIARQFSPFISKLSKHS